MSEPYMTPVSVYNVRRAEDDKVMITGKYALGGFVVLDPDTQRRVDSGEYYVERSSAMCVKPSNGVLLEMARNVYNGSWPVGETIDLMELHRAIGLILMYLEEEQKA